MQLAVRCKVYLAGGFQQDFESASFSCGTEYSNSDSLKNWHCLLIGWSKIMSEKTTIYSPGYNSVKHSGHIWRAFGFGFLLLGLDCLPCRKLCSQIWQFRWFSLRRGCFNFFAVKCTNLRERRKSPFSALCKAVEQEAHIPVGKEGLLRWRVGGIYMVTLDGKPFASTLHISSLDFLHATTR